MLGAMPAMLCHAHDTWRLIFEILMIPVSYLAWNLMFFQAWLRRGNEGLQATDNEKGNREVKHDGQESWKMPGLGSSSHELAIAKYWSEVIGKTRTCTNPRTASLFGRHIGMRNTVKHTTDQVAPWPVSGQDHLVGVLELVGLWCRPWWMMRGWWCMRLTTCHIQKILHWLWWITSDILDTWSMHFAKWWKTKTWTWWQRSVRLKCSVAESLLWRSEMPIQKRPEQTQLKRRHLMSQSQCGQVIRIIHQELKPCRWQMELRQSRESWYGDEMIGSCPSACYLLSVWKWGIWFALQSMEIQTLPVKSFGGLQKQRQRAASSEMSDSDFFTSIDGNLDTGHMQMHIAKLTRTHTHTHIYIYTYVYVRDNIQHT